MIPTKSSDKYFITLLFFKNNQINLTVLPLQKLQSKISFPFPFDSQQKYVINIKAMNKIYTIHLNKNVRGKSQMYTGLLILGEKEPQDISF